METRLTQEKNRFSYCWHWKIYIKYWHAGISEIPKNIFKISEVSRNFIFFSTMCAVMYDTARTNTNIKLRKKSPSRYVPIGILNRNGIPHNNIIVHLTVLIKFDDLLVILAISSLNHCFLSNILIPLKKKFIRKRAI